MFMNFTLMSFKKSFILHINGWNEITSQYNLYKRTVYKIAFISFRGIERHFGGGPRCHSLSRSPKILGFSAKPVSPLSRGPLGGKIEVFTFLIEQRQHPQSGF